jgi:hypothetical protein
MEVEKTAPAIAQECLLEGSAFTLWRFEVEAREGLLPLYYFRAEGGRLHDEERERIFDYYRSQILPSQRNYLQVVDLRRGVEGIAPHVLPLATFCQSVRSQQKEKLLRSALISNSPFLVGVVNCILRLAPPAAPFLISGDEDEVRRRLLRDDAELY